MAHKLYTVEKELSLPPRLRAGDTFGFQIVAQFSETEDRHGLPYVVTAAMPDVRDPQDMTREQVMTNPEVLARIHAPTSQPGLKPRERFDKNQWLPDTQPFQAFWEYVLLLDTLTDIHPRPAVPDRTPETARLKRIASLVTTTAKVR